MHPSGLFAILLAALLGMSRVALADDPTLPPPGTPGVMNPAVTQENIGSTICRRGWTATIRPPPAYTNDPKRQQLAEYGYADRDPRHYEEDHRLPLGVGRHPTDPRNLWPEPRYGQWSANRKDELEGFVNREVCAGRMSLAEGQVIFLGDWIAAYQRYHLSEP